MLHVGQRVWDKGRPGCVLRRNDFQLPHPDYISSIEEHHDRLVESYDIRWYWHFDQSKIDEDINYRIGSHIERQCPRQCIKAEPKIWFIIMWIVGLRPAPSTK